jgi:hypothetical protein
LDALVSGYTDIPEGRINGSVKIYRNDGNDVFTDISAIFAISGFISGHAAWADIDNDGDLDVAVIYRENADANSTHHTKIFKNIGTNTFTDIGVTLKGGFNATLAWADYNKDGYQDLFIQGDQNYAGYFASIYKNNGNYTFTDLNAGMQGAMCSNSAGWGDYNNDTYPDLFYGGYSYGVTYAKLYRNNGNSTFSDIATVIPPTGYSCWIDYNNDNFLDILSRSTKGDSLKIYKNNGNATFSATSLTFPGQGNGAVISADYDNDGYKDVFHTGTINSSSDLFKNNNGSSFSLIANSGIVPLSASDAAFGDYNGDGLLDILIQGWDGSKNVTKIYKASSNVTSVKGCLVASFPFNGNALDVSGNGNNGIVNGAKLTTDRFGNANSAFSFNGSSDYITVPTSTSLDNISQGPITMSCWVNSSSFNGEIILQYSTVSATGGGNTYNLWSYLNNKFNFSNWNHNAGGDWGLITPSTYSTGQWYFICVTIDPSTNITNLYIDGQLAISGNSTINTLPAPVHFFIGRHNNGTGFFNGKIDDVNIFGCVLSQTQIDSLYNVKQPTCDFIPNVSNWLGNSDMANAANIIDNNNASFTSIAMSNYSTVYTQYSEFNFSSPKTISAFKFKYSFPSTTGNNSCTWPSGNIAHTCKVKLYYKSGSNWIEAYTANNLNTLSPVGVCEHIDSTQINFTDKITATNWKVEMVGNYWLGGGYQKTTFFKLFEVKFNECTECDLNPPTVGAITQPTCVLATGSVVLSGLPETGTWTLTRIPGGTITTGTGTSSTISLLEAGTYTFTVTNAKGCISGASANVVINTQPATPTAPALGPNTQPSCIEATGSIFLYGLPAAGTWTLTRTPGGITTTGTGTSKTITGLSSGTYTFKVTNAEGCISGASANLVINNPPLPPAAPAAGPITQPSCTEPTGSVFLYGLPVSGTWTLTRTPGGITTTGTGTSKTIMGLSSGTYTFKVTNAEGCISGSSANVVINKPPVPPAAPTVGPITQPSCTKPTGSVFLYDLPESGTWTLTTTPGGTTIKGTGTGSTITGLSSGTYTYTVTNAEGCTSAVSGNVVISAPVTPVTPVISLNDNILHSDAVTGNQWYNRNGIIAGAINQDYTATSSDDYYVIVSILDCSSDRSNVINFKLTGVELIETSKTIKVYPNPTTDILTIDGLPEIGKVEISIYDINGKLIKKQMSTSSVTKMDIRDVVSGTYLLIVNDQKEQAIKIIKE